MKGSLLFKNAWAAIIAAAIVALCFVPAAAQCSMCRAAIDGAGGAQMAKSLNQGIIVLLIPPVAIFCAIFITAFKRRK